LADGGFTKYSSPEFSRSDSYGTIERRDRIDMYTISPSRRGKGPHFARRSRLPPSLQPSPRFRLSKKTSAGISSDEAGGPEGGILTNRAPTCDRGTTFFVLNTRRPSCSGATRILSCPDLSPGYDFRLDEFLADVRYIQRFPVV